jgi:predicted ester cyclase
VSIKALFRSWTTGFPDLEWIREDALIDGNRTAVAFRFAGTHAGPFLGLAPTNRRFEIRGVTLMTVRDGKIVYERRIYDFTSFLVQLGVIKPFSE